MTDYSAHDDCNAAAEVAPNVWTNCVCGYPHGSKHIVRYGVPDSADPRGRWQHVEWSVADGDRHSVITGRTWCAAQSLEIDQAYTTLFELLHTDKRFGIDPNTLPAEVRELLTDAQRRIRDAYKFLTGHDLDE